MNKILKWMSGMAVMLGIASLAACSDINPINIDDMPQAELLKRDQKKWAAEDSILKKNREDSAAIAENNKRLEEAYLADLLTYKKSKHMVMFGWFAYWKPDSPDKSFSLSYLPDSVDFVSNWGASWNLSEPMLKELEIIHKKGTRMTVGWIIENVGDGLHNAPEGGWSNDPHTAIEQYAQAICDSIAKYNYDGIDIDYEPQFSSPFKAGNHCGDWTENWADRRPLISCQQYSNKEYENYFFTKLREKLPKEKMMNINGSIGWIDPSVAPLFNYFVFQSYNNTAGNWKGTADNLKSSQPLVKDEQFIYTESFQTNPGNAANFARNYANYVKNTLKGKAGGIGAFHINEDYLYGNPPYQNVKNAIAVMNPPFVN